MPNEKLIWMPHYIREIWADTSRLNATQYGAFMSLTENEFLYGPLPNDMGVLCQVARLFATQDQPLDVSENANAPSIPSGNATRSLRAWREHVLRTVLEGFFTLGPDNCWRREQVEIVRAKILNNMTVNSDRARKAARARWGDHVPKHAPSIPPSNPASTSQGNAPGYAKVIGQTETNTRSLRSLSSSASPPLAGGGPGPLGADRPAGEETAANRATGSKAAASNPTPTRSERRAKTTERPPVAIPPGTVRGNHAASTKNRLSTAGKTVAHGVKKRVRPAEVKDLPDPRFSAFKAEIFRYWDQQNSGSPNVGSCPWSGPDRGSLSDLLRASPDLELETFRQLLVNRAHSEVVPSDPPRLWVRDLVRFAAGSLDRYKHLKKAARVH